MIIGVDAGSKFLKLSMLNGSGINGEIYQDHAGAPDRALADIVRAHNIHGPVQQFIFSGHYAGYLADCFPDSYQVNEVSSIVEALRYLNARYSYVVNVGAASIKLIELDQQGDFRSYIENSLCAAGTGSFLDEQMARMNFSYAALQSLPFILDAPDIATRCAVFAKSDLIHRQQEGYTREEMWSGLCRGVVVTMLQSIFKGDVPSERILFCGGFFLNPIVRAWTHQFVEKASFLDNGHFLASIGSLAAHQNGGQKKKKGRILSRQQAKGSDGRTALATIRSRELPISLVREFIEHGNEVRIHSDLADLSNLLLGIDIGSTSTKLTLVDAVTGDVLVDIYRKTDGDPIAATRKLFHQVKSIFAGKAYTIRGAATTGSGRRLVGSIIGADVIVNEITAHFRGARQVDDSIETIFEIGGQDSKYTRGYQGAVIDCNMNYVCAAGTGSFIEEQANRLGFSVREIGDRIMGLVPPDTSDRCTVFMEQDINKLLKEGFSREEVLAGVIQSIVKNYMHRVVGSRPVSGDRVFFQGATARNRGLVAAFESLLRKEIVVSPFCHVMGAYGASLIAGQRGAITSPSLFRGLDILDKNIELDYSRCTECTNSCKLTTVQIEGEPDLTWGYMCGRESKADARERRTDHFRAVLKMTAATMKSVGETRVPAQGHRGTIGIPQTLLMYNYLPLWETFFTQLGFRVIRSGRSNLELKEKGIHLSKADFCFPIKISLAHLVHLAGDQNIDALFYPTQVSEENQKSGLPRVFCPYVISYPSLAKKFIKKDLRFISPAIDFRDREEVIIRELHAHMRDYDIPKNEIREAYRKGFEAMRAFFKERYEYGQRLVSELRGSGKTIIVVIGRPYNLYDRIINLNLTEHLKGTNAEVVPYEFFIDPDMHRSDIYHMYWNYGERILHVAEQIRSMPDTYPVYFTNFSCGPDSFILSRFEKLMRGKPYLIIELDEHGSETGYLTRIEAFLDVVYENRKQTDTHNEAGIDFEPLWTRKDKARTLWIPGMHYINSRFFAAAFRAFGYNAQVLPIEDGRAFEIGKQSVRGSECLPAVTTVGAFLKKLREIDAKPGEHAFFMPTAEGPCRFGQYSVLHRLIIEQNGFADTPVFSPTSVNSYLGMPQALHRRLWDILIMGDLIYKYICAIRPYEIHPGEVDAISEEIVRDLETAVEKRRNLIHETVRACERLSRITIKKERRPLVGIVGEIYVRCNPFCNNELVRYIEANGGEAWLAPMSEWIVYTAWTENYFTRLRGDSILTKAQVALKTSYMLNRLHKFESAVSPYLHHRMEPPIRTVIEKGMEHLPLKFEGEAILTVGRTIRFFEEGASLVVNCAPFGCMPGNITSSLFRDIQPAHNGSIISLFYDGESDVNRVVGIYLDNIGKKTPRADDAAVSLQELQGV